MRYLYLSLILLLSVQLFAQKKQSESVGFIENKGQIVNQKGKKNNAVKYLLNTNGLNIQLRNNGFSYDVYETKKHPLPQSDKENASPFLTKKDTLKNPNYTLEYLYHRIDIDFENSNHEVKLVAEGKSSDYDNYYNVPNEPNGILNVYKFQKIKYQNIYPNIDVVFLIPSDQSKPVEYNFIVKPNGKISDIKLKFNGVKTELVDNKIKMDVRFGQIEETLPLSWTENGNDKEEIAISYKKLKKNVFGFESLSDTSTKTVIIDPVPVRLWGTYYGGDGDEYSNCVVTDLNNFVYISGSSLSPTNIATSGTYQSYISTYGTGFIAKIDSDGTRIWGTYYPANLLNINVDLNSNIYATGNAIYSTNLSSSGSYQPIKNNYNDAYLIKLNSSGLREWATYYGGNDNEDGYSMCFDTNNNVYLCGGTSSTDVFSSPGAYQTNNNTTTNNYERDAFIAKFDSNGNRIWGTFYGGEGSDSFFNISISNDGFLYASGWTTSSTNIATVGSYQPNSTASTNGMVVKFTLNGQRVWGTYICDDSYIYNAKLIGDNLFLTGQTSNQTSIGTIGTFYDTYQPLPTSNYLNNDTNSFIVKFNVQTQQKIWGTYFFEVIAGMDVNQNDEVYFSGNTGINSGIATPDGYMPTKSFFDKSYLIKLDSNGQRVWGTYYGGDSVEVNGHVNIDSQQNIYLYGITRGSTTGIATANAHQTVVGSNPDTYLVKFKDCVSATTASSNSPICVGSNLILTAIGGTNFSWTGPNGFTSNQQNPIIVNANATHSGLYTCAITGTGGCDGSSNVNVVVGDPIKPIPNIITLPIITGNCTTVISTIPTATDNCAGTINATTTDPLSYSLPGSYAINWAYNDGNGNFENQTQTVTITAVTLPTITTPQTFCIQQNATINDIQITGQNIKWYDALTTGNLITNTTSLQNNTTYYASQTINGCESTRVPVVITIQNTPPPSGNSTQSFCSSQNATLNNIVISGNTIKWYDTISSTTPLSSSTPLVNGSTYYASQTINGCESTLKLAITVSLISTLNAYNYEETKCDDLNDGAESVTLTNYNSDLIASITNVSFSYYSSFLGAENQTTSLSIIPNYNLIIGSHIIYVRIDSTNGCHQIVELKLTLLAAPIISLADTVTLCKNKNVTINTNSSYNSYLWSTGETTPTITVNQPGNYFLTVTENHGTLVCSSTKNFSVVLSSVAVISTIGTQDWNDTENVIIANANGLGNYEYSIDGIHYQDSNVFSGLETGVYTITVRDKNGCGIVKDDVYLLAYPKFFSPNGDGYNDFWSIKYSRYEQGLKVDLYDRYGKFIKELHYNESWDGTYNGTELPSTDYWFLVTRADGKQHRGHFTLKR